MVDKFARGVLTLVAVAGLILGTFLLISGVGLLLGLGFVLGGGYLLHKRRDV